MFLRKTISVSREYRLIEQIKKRRGDKEIKTNTIYLTDSLLIIEFSLLLLQPTKIIPVHFPRVAERYRLLAIICANRIFLSTQHYQINVFMGIRM